MKTSFAEFELCVSKEKSGKTFIDCEKVLAVSAYYDVDDEEVKDVSSVILGPSHSYLVKGSPKDILYAVKAYCKERKP